MLRVALTGGIASGKTTASTLFKTLGVPVIDTDEISHQLMQRGEPGYQATLDHFGAHVLNPDLTLNRAILREIVFNDSTQKQWLEKMLHPLIRDRAIQEMDSLPDTTPYLILVVPLLFESGFDSLVDRVIAIDCPLEVQMRRLMQRDGSSTALARQMIEAQWSNQQRLQQADDIITNQDDLDLQPQIASLHQKLSRLSRQHLEDQ